MNQQWIRRAGLLFFLALTPQIAGGNRDASHQLDTDHSELEYPYPEFGFESLSHIDR